MTHETTILRRCMFEPTADVLEAGLLIEEAGLHLLSDDRTRAAEALREADRQALLRYFEEATGPAVFPRSRPPLPKKCQQPRLQPTKSQLRKLFERDGWRCRFCGVRVIEIEVREKFQKELPDVARWGRKTADCHAGLLVHMGSHDHVLPLSYGGSNADENLVVACWVCQFARGEWLLEDVLVTDPRSRPPLRDGWEGLVRILNTRAA